MTTRTMRCLVLALCCTLMCAFAGAQTATVNARLTAGVVKLGGDLKLVIEVDNARVASITRLPQVKDLRFGAIPTPELQQRYQISGSRQIVTRSLTWVIDVHTDSKGEYKIPGVDLDVDGQSVTTRELPFKVVPDIQGDEMGLFEVDAPSDIVEGQPFTLEMRFGWDTALATQVNYVQLSVPWLGGLAGLLELDTPPPQVGLQTVLLQLNERGRITAEDLGQQQLNGRTFRVLRVRKRFLATRAGDLELSTSMCEFGRAATDSLFQRGDPGVAYYKRSPATTIHVLRLPTENQPLDFSGAIGSLSVNAVADHRDVDAGDSIKLTVDWTGTGNLEFFTPPDLSRVDAFKGFHVYGTNDRKSVDRRSVTYDLAPLGPEVTEIPPVPLSVYDLEKKAYVTIQSAPIPIRVTALKNASGLGAATRNAGVSVDIRDIQTQALSDRSTHGPGGTALIAGAAGIAVGWFALRTSVRRRGDPDAPRARARRRARKQLARGLQDARTASDEARALRRFLADRSGDLPEAWVGRDVRDWAREQREERALTLSDADALALQQTVSKLDESTWAGQDAPVGNDQVLGLADQLLKGGL